MELVKNENNGFTLVEVLITLVIMGIAIGGIYSMFDLHNKMAAIQEEKTTMQQELLTAIVQMTDDIRMGGYAPNGGTFGYLNRPGSGSPNYGRATNSTSLYCTWDGNENGVFDENSTINESISYRINVNDDGSPRSVSDNILRRYNNGKWEVVATNIGNISYVYYDENGQIIADPASNLSKIWSVQIQLTAIASDRRKGLAVGNRTMSSTVLCRNVGK